MNLLLFIICFMHIKTLYCPDYLYWLGLFIGFSSFVFRLYANIIKRVARNGYTK